jgi:NAD(P)-dependent dehydrogenase (short-subunit alcohol dehydrogenase family)
MPLPLFDLSGKTAVITGGSRGIGLMLATGFVEAGASVVVSSRSAAGCEEAAHSLRVKAASSGQAIGVYAIPADLAEESECRRLAQEVELQAGRVDVLVNNAGAVWGASLEQFPAKAWDKVIDLNVKSPFYLTQAFLPMLEASGTQDDPSRIINIGSVDGMHVPHLPTYSYSASKAAIHHLTRVLARELGPRHITVNAIAPGPFETKMMEHTLRSERSVFVEASPLGRLGRPDDMSGVGVFLASRAAAYVTGSVLAVDGGIATTL